MLLSPYYFKSRRCLNCKKRYSESPENGGLNMVNERNKIVWEKEPDRENGSVSIANRKYKDTIFRSLFSDKRNLLSLYNALNEKDYDDPDELEIVTLESAVYMGMKNDLAFILDLNLFLFEHQSTYNPNIPLRDLLYIASEYQKLVDTKSLYSSSLLRIPAPRFVVFYNGIREIGEYMEHRLSEAYENLVGEPALELKVMVFNINDGRNQKLMEQCRILKEYSQYVARVRKYSKIMKLDDAVRQAVDECISEGILADFLSQNRAEAIRMSIFEYDKEVEERKLRKAEFEYGKSEGEKAQSIIFVKRMLKAGEPLEKIQKYTGCTIEEIQKLCDK